MSLKTIRKVKQQLLDWPGGVTASPTAVLAAVTLLLSLPLQAGSLSQPVAMQQRHATTTQLGQRQQPHAANLSMTAANSVNIARTQMTDYAAWAQHNTDGSWTRAAEYAVGNSVLPKLQPRDIAQFCPQYPRLPAAERKQFWVGLLSAMSKPESNFKPASYYQERFHDRQGKPVISRGLLQISQESANQRRYGCDIRHAALLHDPVINLACGVRILSLWVQQDGQIATPKAAEPTGGGRYWSTLRHSNGKTTQISEFTRGMAVCQGKPSQSLTAKTSAKPQQIAATSKNNGGRIKLNGSSADDKPVIKSNTTAPDS